MVVVVVVLVVVVLVVVLVVLVAVLAVLVVLVVVLVVLAVVLVVLVVVLVVVISMTTTIIPTSKVIRESETRIQSPDLMIWFLGDFGMRNPNFRVTMLIFKLGGIRNPGRKIKMCLLTSFV